jgi:tetratricopeptide (TPR) repeat protein
MGPAPDEIAALMNMVSQDRLAHAEERAGTLLRAYPTDGMLWKIFSVVLLRRDKDAIPALRRAAELLPRDPEAHANLGAELRIRGHWHDALTSLRKSLTLQPRNPEALIDAAEVQRALGSPREAVVLYQEALHLDPSRRDAHNNLGNAFLELGDVAEAARCYRQALRLQTEDAQVLCNLANALRQLGESEEAITCSRRAIELAPRLSMAHNNLGLLLLARGERAAAISSFQEALRHSPDYIEALGNLGNALREEGQRREALAVHQRALQLDPRRADSHCNLAYVLLDYRQMSEAAASFRAALELNQNHAASHVGLAIAQRIQGLSAQAEASCQAALRLAPQRADVLLLLGELHADRGQFIEAQGLFERALAADRKCAPAYSSIALHRHMKRDDTVWLQGAQGLLAQPLPLDHAIQLRHALGKYYDDIAEYDRAFDHHRAANELTKRFGRSYDGPRLTSLVERIIAWCDAVAARRGRLEGSDSERPVFILGMPRSGTTLAEQILASHPGVFGAGEVRFWDAPFTGLEQALQRDQLEQLLAEVAQQYLGRVAEQAGAALRITDKLPANFLYAGVIHRIFPRARIIHLQRHPLDTCLSVYFQNFFNAGPYANDLTDLAHYYGVYGRIMSHWRGVLPSQSLLEVPYEELVKDTEGWTRRMLEFIGLPWDPRCLDFQRTERVVMTASKWQVRQKVTTTSVGRWRNYEKHLGPLRHLEQT